MKTGQKEIVGARIGISPNSPNPKSLMEAVWDNAPLPADSPVQMDAGAVSDGLSEMLAVLRRIHDAGCAVDECRRLAAVIQALKAAALESPGRWASVSFVHRAEFADLTKQIAAATAHEGELLDGASLLAAVRRVLA